MSNTTLWLTMVGMGLITYGIRLSLIMLMERVHVPEQVQRGLRYVPPAVLTAVIVPELLRPAGPLDLSLANVRLLAGVMAVVVAWRSRNALLTIAAGMAALWVLQAVLK